MEPRMNTVKQYVITLVRKLGYDIVRFRPKTHPLARRIRILESYGVDHIIDIGANVGQYGLELREIGYRGRISSFEPLSSAYKLLHSRASRDKLWDTYNFALGDKIESAVINIAANSYSSSILDMLPLHTKTYPTSEYTGTECIKVRTLDSIFTDLCSQSTRIYLKIDTQGFEKNVLIGADNSLSSIDTIQLEMSLTPLYKDELTFIEMYTFLEEKGFKLIAVEPGFTDKETGRLLQLDGIFHRMQE
jgi:FkbM family methyltransferase